MYLVYPPSDRWFDQMGCSGTLPFGKIESLQNILIML